MASLLCLVPTDKFSILSICDSTLAEAPPLPGSVSWYQIRSAARHAAWLRKRNAAGNRSLAPQTKNWEFAEHTERKQELTLNGVRATSLICWPGLFGHCSCGDVKKAHCFEGCCGGGLNMAIGGNKKRRCRKLPSMCRNRHPTEEEAISALESWHISSGQGRPVLGRAAAPALRVISGASAATAASSGSDGGGTTGEHRQSAFQLRGQRCTVPPETLIRRLARRPSAYVSRLLREPFFAELVADDRLRQLLCMRKAHKEVTEAYGVADRVLKVVHRLASRPQRGGGAAIDPVTGAGLVVLDMCSGRGVPAMLVSFLLPRARVVMLDADGGMDLSHVASRPNLQFEAFDLFSADAARNLEAIVDGGACVAYGVHLCGALSPRLATLACRLPCIDALVLCPCCLRGSLGRDVQREAAQAGGGEAAHYPVLVDTVAGLCRRQAFRGRGQPMDKPQQHREGGEGLPSTALAPLVRGEVTVEFDSCVLSPKNGFITVVKSDLLESPTMEEEAAAGHAAAGVAAPGSPGFV